MGRFILNIKLYFYFYSKALVKLVSEFNYRYGTNYKVSITYDKIHNRYQVAMNHENPDIVIFKIQYKRNLSGLLKTSFVSFVGYLALSETKQSGIINIISPKDLVKYRKD